MSALPDPKTPRVLPIRGTANQDVAIDPAPRLKRRRMLIVGAALGVLLLVALATPALRALIGGERAVAAERVRIATVERGRFLNDVAAQGVVVAALSPTLVAPAPGIVRYSVRAGEAVTKGQPLAVVESPELQNELAREKAALESQEAAFARESIEIRRKMLLSRQGADTSNLKLQAAEREFRRAEQSWEMKVISRRDFDKARDDLEAARIDQKHSVDSAALEQESLGLELKMKRLERDRQRLLVQDLERRSADLTLRSPVDGVVGTLAVAERANVAANATVVTVVDPSVYEVEFTAPDSYAGSLKPGMEAEVAVGAGTAAAKLVALSPEVRQGQIVGRLRFTGAQPAGLSQNQRVPVRIRIDVRDGVLKVERGAFVDTGGGRVAYRVDGDTATRVAISLGASSATEVEILDGLQAGDRIVVTGVDAFEGAERVRLTN
jgi:HlyD family secretion protein